MWSNPLVLKKKYGFQAKMKAISTRNKKVCVIVCTIYQMQALTNDTIHYNQMAEGGYQGREEEGRESNEGERVGSRK